MVTVSSPRWQSLMLLMNCRGLRLCHISYNMLVTRHTINHT
jgi:hypothetical protein